MTLPEHFKPVVFRPYENGQDAIMLAQCTVVVPTIGRPSLDVLLDALATAPGADHADRRQAGAVGVQRLPGGAVVDHDQLGGARR